MLAPLPGWSMAKSVLNALIGIRVREGGLALDARDLHPAWNRPDDTRRRITVQDLLYARSGLRFNEDYGPGSDVRQMLFNEVDMAGFAASQPLEYEVGTHWAYSSGTANILSWVLRRSFARGHWGQHIAVIPAHDLVVVRLGWTIDESAWVAAFTARVVQAVRQ